MQKPEDWSKFLKSKCPLCQRTPDCPVRFKALKCKCRNKEVYCMVCLRDVLGFGLSGERTLTNCPTCQKVLRFEEGLNARKSYYPLEPLANLYDEEYGKISCPRQCEWTGYRYQIKDHNETCPKSLRLCPHCRTRLTLSEIEEHKLVCGFDKALGSLLDE